MQNKKEPRYQKIAYEIAKRIVSYQINEGDKLRGRSMLASEYGVSSETIRKAMRLLTNIGVVEVRSRSGIYVVSRNAANLYIEQYKKQHETNRLFTDTQELLNESERVHRMLEKHVRRLLETSKSDVFPFDYFTIKLKEEDDNLGESLSSLRFWNQTQGLVLAVEHDNHLYQAPNPKLNLEAGMILYVLGDDSVKSNTLSLFGRD
ncbi:MAG: GntR family transcriptional regulator [Candidatus Izemoplasmataceae bacterium]